MKITEDARKFAAEQGLAEEEALHAGMEEKSRQFVEKGSEVYAKTLCPGSARLQRAGFGILPKRT